MPRDEPGPGGVRVGATRSDLDCRVVATSRCVAPTECDSRLPLFGCGSTCRLRLLDSWPPRAEALVFDSSRGRDSSVATCRPRQSPTRPTYVARGGSGVARLVRLVRLCQSDSSLNKVVTGHATHQTCLRSKMRPTRRRQPPTKQLSPGLCPPTAF